MDNITDRAKEAIEDRIEKIERLIAKKGIGNKYVAKVEKAQRNANLIALFSLVTIIAGAITWFSVKDKD